MALDHAILVSLTERAASGYDLARRFDASIGFFWPASHQQIYKVLARMQEAGWVEGTLQEQDGRPDKRTYAITAAGEAELDRWAAERSGREALRSDFAVKLRAFRDPEAILADTRDRRAAHVERLAEYEASEARFYPDPAALEGADLGSWLALRGGIVGEHQGIAWCDEILTALEGRGSR
ncbi:MULTISPECIES: PadR family transcriptional regulator [unclassified Aeromicrobium]|uniref:PadR family transcriptional regulator n=1 Tax=unclassified Aeromicrobium TaxID=2633570 RepID=UPI00396B2D94